MFGVTANIDKTYKRNRPRVSSLYCTVLSKSRSKTARSKII